MCGIAGFCINPRDTHINARHLASRLLLGIEHRGKDASGAAWRDRRGHMTVQKRALTASEFTPGLSMDKRASMAVLHTRMWTQGSPDNPLNNHPITSGEIIGVHNGYLSNDDQLIRHAEKFGYKRLGEVDSEAIFATIDRVGRDSDEKFDLVAALEEPEAKMAVAWVDLSDENKNTLYLARGDGSPLVVAQTANGSLIFASEADAIKDALEPIGEGIAYLEHVKEGSFMKVRDGLIVEAWSFRPTPAWGYSYRGGSGGGRITTTTTFTGSNTTPKSATSVSTNAITKNHGTTYLDMRYLDIDTEVESLPAASFNSMYKTRCDNIREWMERNAFVAEGESLDNDHAVFEKAAERGAFLRPGAKVFTKFCDDWCEAQVYRLPKTFPEGDYILRVLAPQTDLATGEVYTEPVFLARTVMDIEGEDLYWDLGANGKDDKDDVNKDDVTNEQSEKDESKGGMVVVPLRALTSGDAS